MYVTSYTYFYAYTLYACNTFIAPSAVMKYKQDTGKSSILRYQLYYTLDRLIHPHVEY